MNFMQVVKDLVEKKLPKCGIDDPWSAAAGVDPAEFKDTLLYNNAVKLLEAHEAELGQKSTKHHATRLRKVKKAIKSLADKMLKTYLSVYQ